MHKLVQIVRFEAARKLTKVPEGHPCGNLYGLAFKLEIHVEGEMNPENGFVIDFDHIKESGFGPTMEKLDHNYLNNIKGLENPTSEILIKWIWEELYNQFHMSWNQDEANSLKPLCKLTKLVLWENEVSRVEYDGAGTNYQM